MTATISTVLRSRCGAIVPLDVDRWHGDIDAVELAALEGLGDPVLDVGCGPGRIVAALTAGGRRATGIDISPTAARHAHRRGATVLTQSIFDPLPDASAWGSVLLLDGNIGIGGEPVRLLRRVRELLADSGAVVVEVGAPGSPNDRLTVRVEATTACAGPWFEWARLSAEQAGPTFSAAGLEHESTVQHGDRWFARARRCDS